MPTTSSESPVPRLSIRAFLTDLADELFSLDHGLPWTIGQLLRRPGWVARRYVDQRDPRLTKPLRLTLVCLALASLLMHLLGANSLDIYVDAAVLGAAEASGPDTSSNAAFIRALHGFLAQFDLVLVLCWVPGAASAVQRAYRGLQLNLAEGLVFGLYSLSMALLLAPPLYCGVELAGDGEMAVAMLPILAVGLSAYGYARPEGHGALRALGCSLLMVLATYLWSIAVLLVWSLVIWLGLG